MPIGRRNPKSAELSRGKEWPCVYRWKPVRSEGPALQVTARGTLNSARVEFEDGFLMVTSRNALKRTTGPAQTSPSGRGSPRATSPS